MTSVHLRGFFLSAVAATLVFMATSPPSAAQALEYGQLTATITDSNGNPVRNYPVVIQQLSDETLEEYENTKMYSIRASDWTALVATDQNGIVVLPELPAGGTYAIVPTTDPVPYVTFSTPANPKASFLDRLFLAPASKQAESIPTLSAGEISEITGTTLIDLSRDGAAKSMQIQLAD